MKKYLSNLLRYFKFFYTIKWTLVLKKILNSILILRKINFISREEISKCILQFTGTGIY